MTVDNPIFLRTQLRPMTYPNDPIVAAMRAAHRAGISVHAIALACGMGWRTVKEIVRNV